jgi:murein DD-endopeptidase MepM/ murein hydrolase activator NlpD
MIEEKKKKRNWTEKLRLTLSREETFEEIWNIRITRAGFLAALFSFILGIIIAVSLLIAFTDLRELIPGYPDVTVREDIVRNAILLDSLEHEIKLRDLYLNNIQKIINGETPDNFTSDADTLKSQDRIEFSRSVEDSILRQQIESEEAFDLSVTRDYRERQVDFYRMAFYPPVKGLISAHFDPARSHFATDIVGVPGGVVHSTLDGTVIFTGWTLETGYVIAVQHSNNLVSIYKHNSRLLRSVGAVVRAGEDIALMGTTGELYTTGPHLHFELWYNGQPIDAEKFILF